MLDGLRSTSSTPSTSNSQTMVGWRGREEEREGIPYGKREERKSWTVDGTINRSILFQDSIIRDSEGTVLSGTAEGLISLLLPSSSIHSPLTSSSYSFTLLLNIRTTMAPLDVLISLFHVRLYSNPIYSFFGDEEDGMQIKYSIKITMNEFNFSRRCILKIRRESISVERNDQNSSIQSILSHQCGLLIFLMISPISKWLGGERLFQAVVCHRTESVFYEWYCDGCYNTIVRYARHI